MTGFFFAFLACLLAGVGARDQVIVARLVERLGARVALLATALGTACLASAVAVWGAVRIADIMPLRARLVLVALALALAGLEALLLKPPRAPDEPTRSLGAAGLVLLAQQLTDSARFLIFAIALGTLAPVPAGLGGALGSGAALVAGWLAGGELFQPWLGRARRLLGAALIGCALIVGYQLIR